MSKTEAGDQQEGRKFWSSFLIHACSCPTLCDPMDCSPPGSSVHGIFQARILEWVVISSSRGSFQPRGWTHISCLAGRFFTTEPPGNPPSLPSCPLLEKCSRTTDVRETSWAQPEKLASLGDLARWNASLVRNGRKDPRRGSTESRHCWVQRKDMQLPGRRCSLFPVCWSLQD